MAVFRPVRRGVAAAELAVCLPTVALLVFAAIEGANMVYLSHSLAVAAYEGARVAIRPGSTSQDVITQCTEVYSSRNVVDASVSLSPPQSDTVERGTAITVTVSAPCDANNSLTPWFFGGKSASANVTMVKE